MKGRSILRLAGLALAASVALVTAATSAPLAGDAALEPYRALARTPDAARLLAIARGAMDARWSEGASGDSADASESDALPSPVATGDAVPIIAWSGPPVTLYLSLARGATTRACVGRTVTSGTLSSAVARLAVEALEADPRRPPVRRDELAELRLLIAFAGEGEALSDPMLADPARDGLSITTTHGTIAFLPGEARTVAWALREARRVGIVERAAGAPSYRRFPVVVIAEPERASKPARRDLDATP